MRTVGVTAWVLCSLLCGCGDAYERVYLDKWAAAGSVGRPTDPYIVRTKFRVTTLEPGRGAAIEPGSLVHARINGSLPRANYAGARAETVDDVWFWIGNPEPYVKNRPTISLGSGILRAALIGARAGARLSLVFDTSQVGAELHLPTKGFLLDHSEEVYFDTGVDGEYAKLTAWRDYEITILAVCRGRLLRRQGTLKQWGYILHVWAESPNYPFARDGPLIWGAVEGDCESPEQRVRLEKGPAYHPYSGSLTGSWPRSYARAVQTGRASEK